MALKVTYANSLVDKSQEEVAQCFGVSQQYIQQIEKKALSKFKKKFCKMYPDTWKLIHDEIGKGHF